MNETDVLKSIEVILTTYIKYEEKESTIYKESICNGRYLEFYKGYKLAKHLSGNDDCKILHELDQTNMENV